jgi:exopolysaccharide biosynthesis polyprenyl glycosylphosphotransferase
MSQPIPPARANMVEQYGGAGPDGHLALGNGDSSAAAKRGALLPQKTYPVPPAAPAQVRRPRRRSGATPEIRLQLRLFRLTDLFMVMSVLLLVFLATNIGHTAEDARAFLELRITVKNLLLLSLFALAWRALCLATGLYDWKAIRRRRWEALRVVLTCSLVSAVALAFPAMSVTGAFRYEAVLYFWIGSSVGILLLRSLVRTLVPEPQPGIIRDALIVGTGPRGQRLYRDLGATRGAEYNIVGFVDTANYPPPGRPGMIIGRLEELEGILMRNAIDEVLVALPIKSHYAEIQRVLESCQRVGVRAKFLADLFETSYSASEVEDDRVSVVAGPQSPEGWHLVSKRVIDLGGATAGLVLLSPVLLLAALAIKMTSAGPVFFTQERYGLNRRLFKMYKLRTMVVDADALQAALEERNEATGPVFKIRDDPRLTRVGRWLRRSSLDEMPQLINVLRGEMSLVGPRPLPVRDVHRFTEAALMRRFSVRPGCTCLWQISGRNNLTFDDWIRLDLEYIDRWSIGLDVLVLCRTIPAVLRGTGAL